MRATHGFTDRAFRAPGNREHIAGQCTLSVRRMENKVGIVIGLFDGQSLQYYRYHLVKLG